jgi:hypothetical protein
MFDKFFSRINSSSSSLDSGQNFKKSDTEERPTENREQTDIISEQIDDIRNQLHYLDPYSKDTAIIEKRKELYDKLRQLGTRVV